MRVALASRLFQIKNFATPRNQEGIAMDKQELVKIPYERYQAWQKSTEMLGDVASSLRHELQCISEHPTRQQIERTARAARAVEASLTGAARGLACALALSLENAASEVLVWSRS